MASAAIEEGRIQGRVAASAPRDPPGSIQWAEDQLTRKVGRVLVGDPKEAVCHGVLQGNGPERLEVGDLIRLETERPRDVKVRGYVEAEPFLKYTAPVLACRMSCWAAIIWLL